jgi:Ran GTPase-activating protein (RanGAP) involved in mRNA processing and transport
MTLLAITPQMSSQAIAERLTRAKAEKHLTCIAFFETTFDDTVAGAVISFFRSSLQNTKRSSWRKLSLFSCRGLSQIDSVIEVAVSLDIFEELMIKEFPDRSQQVQFEDRRHFFRSIGNCIKFNYNLKKLNLMNLSISKEQGVALSHGLKTTTRQTPLEQLLLFRICFAEEAISELAAGLQQNKNIRTLAVTACNLVDSQVAMLVEALVSHPSLKVLRIFQNKCRVNGMKAISKLLSSDASKLESLDLRNQCFEHEDEEKFDCEILAEGLRSNQSIQNLDLSSNRLTDQDMDCLGRILWTCPRIHELILEDNSITNSGLELLSSHQIPSRLRRLRLQGNPLSDVGAEMLLRILNVHVELGYVDCNRFWIRSGYRSEIQHELDLNRCGRFLLIHSDEVPVSIWSLVLERVNIFFQSQKARRANVLFQLLHGPALLQRATGTLKTITSGRVSMSTPTRNGKRKRKREEEPVLASTGRV